jgi:small subunit ribosomal protein S4e
MARGVKRHLKRLHAPHHWMLDKLTGTWAPKPSAGPHKLRECLPLIILLRNRLRYALTRNEVTLICKQRLIQVDGRVRTDINYPAGFMDVITIEKTSENFRLLYDTKGRFAIHPITPEEARYKLCKVRKLAIGKGGHPFAATHDGRTFRFPNPDVKENDTVKIDLETGKPVDMIKFEPGNLTMVSGGRNTGRIGVLESVEKHQGSFNIAHMKDSRGHTFSTRVSNVFIIGKGTTSLVSLPKGKGIKLSIAEESEKRK